MEITLNLKPIPATGWNFTAFEFAYEDQILVFDCETPEDGEALFAYFRKLVSGFDSIKFSLNAPTFDSEPEKHYISGERRCMKELFALVKSHFTMVEFFPWIPHHLPRTLISRTPGRLVFFLGSKESHPDWVEDRRTLLKKQEAQPYVWSQ